MSGAPARADPHACASAGREAVAAPILAVEGLAKRYEMHHLGQSVPAFGPVSFTLRPGEMLRLAGPNGAGKSTLLRALHRSCRPTAGRIWYAAPEGPFDLACAADVDVALLRRREIGFVTQFLAARPRVPAEEVVAEPLRLAGRAETEALDAAREALEAFGVAPALWRAYPRTFSGGEQQKVNLARALILPRRLLLLDEPTASLDAGARAALAERLGSLKAQGVAMVGVFHHPGDVAHLIDREIVLRPAEEVAHAAV